MQYEKATGKEMQEALKRGDTSATALLKEAKRVIQEKDSKVKAFIEVFDSAEEDAARADAMRKEGKATPLTGIPIAVKDNICIQGNTATAASKILKGYVAPYDATVIKNLRESGAVLVGRTNLDEFAMGSSTEHSVYGTTYNPHDVERVSGGSSGGSAAAVAMGAVPLALGSDTGGSIRQPASFCGVVGLKPTYGTVSRHGLIALGSSLDVIGPIARTAEDAELLFSVLRGEKEQYDSTIGIFEDEEKSTDVKKVIGIPEGLKSMGLSEETLQAFDGTVKKMQKDGYTVREVTLPIMEKAGSIYYIIQPAEASSNLARFDGMRYGHHEDDADLWGDYIKTRSSGFGEEVSRRIVVGTYVLSAGYYDAYYKKAQAARQVMREEFLETLQEVEVIAMPTTPDVAFKEGAIQDPIAMYAEDRLTLQANLTGLPAISVPMQTEGLPRGIQFIGNYGSESTLFAYARTVEKQEKKQSYV